MKKLLLLVLLTLPFFTLGQTSHRFPDSNAVWHQHFIQQEPYYDNHYQYGIFGDTILDSKLYHKVYLKGNCLTDTSFTIYNSTLVGALREDSLKRLFFYDMGLNTGLTQVGHVYILYDFSIQPGDTVEYGPEYAIDRLILYSIDSVWAIDHFRKRYNFSGSSWIEGIGSTDGLFFALTPIPLCICSYELVCYKNKEVAYYLAQFYSSCYDITTIVEPEGEKRKYPEVYPNPVTSIATLDLSELEEPIANIEFYNILGAKISECAIRSNGRIIIDRNDFAPGLYVFSIITLNHQDRINGKFIVK